jgi:hypothetical protein
MERYRKGWRMRERESERKGIRDRKIQAWIENKRDRKGIRGSKIRE